MKTIKVKFLGFRDCPLEKFAFYEFLYEKYNVVETEEPDYVICSLFGDPYEYCKYPQVRIMYSGENFIPDFNVVDYALSPYPITYYDRHLYYPSFVNNRERTMALETHDRNYDKSIFDDKVYFANFIAGHESEFGYRGGFFRKLSEYKRVESPGTYMNNMPNGEVVKFLTDSKTDFQKKCKFTLCFESTKHEGFVTEKIVDAFYADTIPIYYGSNEVKNIFNEKAFINCGDYESFEDVFEVIKELDQNDEKYLEMLRQPIFVNSSFGSDMYKQLEAYLENIFEQPVEMAYRRSRVYAPAYYNKILAHLSTSLSSQAKVPLKKRIARKIRRMLKF